MAPEKGKVDVAPKKVLIVGAGPCGLLSLRHCLDMGLNAVCVDKRHCVGGIWGIEPGETGAMYDGMRTILPKEIMAAPGLDYRPDLPSFIGRADVNEYFQDYAKEFNLEPKIRFQTQLVSIEPLKGSFLVTTTTKRIFDSEESKEEKKTADMFDEKTVELFDVVVICTGNASTPNPPSFIGQDSFRGKVMHSVQYKNAKKQFSKDDTVVIIGAKASAWSIAHLLSPAVKEVVVVKRKNGEFWPQTDVPENVHSRTYDFAGFYEDGLITSTGEKVPCSGVVYCTGYKIDLPFLDLNQFPGLCVDGPAYVGPLYNELVSIANPNLMFVGFSRHCLGMNAFDIQARYVAHVIADKIPDLDRKMAEAEQKPYIDSRGRPSISNPKSVTLEDFSNSLLAEIKHAPLRPVIMGIYQEVLAKRECSLPQIRSLNYRIIDDITFKSYVGDA